MTTKISSDNIQAATLATIGSGPRITQVLVCDSSYNELDDTAVDIAGGYIKIVGSGFKTGATVTINRQQATSVTFVSATELHAQVAAEAAGTYVVYVVNSDGGVALRVNGVTFSTLPAWSTPSTLPNGDSDTAISIQLTAASAVSYSLAAGSTLPPGLTLSSGGLLSGTVEIQNETLYNFQVVATDLELQDSPRSFSITITVGDPLFAQTTLLLSGTADTFVKDASANNFAVTVAGDTRPNSFNPYLTGWSNYFNGSTTYLTAPVTSSSGDLTIECWIYPTAITSPRGFIVTSGGNDATAWGLSYNTDSRIGLWLGSYGGAYLNSTTTIPLNTWGHIAIVKTSGTVFLYVNGEVVSPSVAQAGTFGSANNAYFGTYNAAINTQSFAGYISNFRYVDGTALYTGTRFTLPTEPLTAISGTRLLTCQSNRFIDESANNFTITRNGDVKVQSFSPFVESATTNGSGYFDGTGDYITAPANAALQLTGDFTVEAWIYSTVVNTFNMIFGSENGQSSDYLTIRPSTIELAIGASVYPAWTQTFVANRWYHIAVTRQSNTLRAFVDGVQLTLSSGSATSSSQYFQSGVGVSIGRYGYTVTPHHFTGYISNARIVKGTAVYTADFTPPTQPLTAVANTSLLTLQNNQPHNNSQFLDSGTNNFPITRAGNTTQGSFSPYSPSGWSAYFDGTGDYLTATSSASFNPENEDFTVELWAYNQTTDSTNRKCLIATRPVATPLNGWVLFVSTTGFVGLAGWNSSGTLVLDFTTTNTPIVKNTWAHVAVVKVGNLFTIYVDGVLAGSATASATFANGTNFVIGSEPASSTRDWKGYISNVRIVKGTAVYTANFTPPTQPLTAVPGTSLLTCADNRTVDDSPNNFAITRNGDVRVVSFSPFKAVVQTPTTYSAYFNGSSYISVPDNADWALGTSDFTIECWVNGTNTSGFIFNQVRSTNTDRINLRIVSPGIINFRVRSNSIYEIDFSTTSNTLPANTWTHIAVVRNGSSFTIYVNGVSSATTTSSFSIPNIPSTLNISDASSYYTGYISNFRWVKGTAVYVADFTPPTQPLTAITNTSLLACQSATFVDNSTNRFAITAAGNVQPTAVNPFGSTFVTSQEYTALERAGSVYLDGTGDTLSVATSNILNFGTGDFTVEFWMYLTATSSTTPGSIVHPASTGDFTIHVINNQVQIARYNVGSDLTYSGAPPLNTWTHWAFTRQSGTGYIFLNGTVVASGAISTNYAGTSFNLNSGNPVYFSNLRIIKGTALYTSSFAPPVAPAQPVANTVLLLNGTAAGIVDTTTKNVLETVGDARVSTAVSKFGGSSMYFDGTGDWIQVPGTNPSLAFGTGAFTVEFWFYSLAASGTQQLFDTRPAGTTSTSGYMALTYSGSLNYYTAGGNPIAGGAVSANAWHHVALTRSGTSTRMFVDGVQVGSTYTDTNTYLNGLNRPIIGADGNAPSASLTGYIQDFRITTGTARYTANFTPPTSAFRAK